MEKMAKGQSFVELTTYLMEHGKDEDARKFRVNYNIKYTVKYVWIQVDV